MNPYDCDSPATKAGLERLMRALISTGSHFTSSFSLGRVDIPSSVTVFFRVMIPEGSEAAFEEMAKVKLKRPPTVRLA